MSPAYRDANFQEEANHNKFKSVYPMNELSVSIDEQQARSVVVQPQLANPATYEMTKAQDQSQLEDSLIENDQPLS